MNRTIRVVLLWLLFALAALPAAVALDRRVEPASRVDGEESALVEDALAASFGSPFARTAVLVLPDIPDVASDAGRARVRSIVALFDTLPFVSGVTSPATSLDTLLSGTMATGAVVVVGIDEAAAGSASVDALRAATADIGTEALWTGRVALETDLRRAGAAETRRAELRAIPASLILAVWAFGGIAGALAGVAAGALTILVALALTAAATLGLPITVIAPGIASLLGLALGIDYALLVMTRSGERASGMGEARRDGDTAAAVATVRIAAFAAAAGFAPLLFVPVSELRSAAIAAMAAIAAAAFVSIVWVPRARAVMRRTPALPAAPVGREDRWVRVVRHVVRRPVVALVLSLPPLLLLGAAATRLEIGLHDVRSLPTGIESARALDRLSDMGRAEVALGLRAIVTLPDGQTVFDDAGWATIGRIERALLADPRIADVRSVRTASGGVPPAAVWSVFPESGLRTFTSRDETRALIDVIPVRGTGARAAATLVRDLRGGHAGATMQIGGVPAYSVDYADAIAAHAVRAVALATVGAFFVLLVAFRSVLVAVKAVALNLLSAAAAVGATVLVFQEGVAGPLSGLSTPLDGVVPTVPLLVFCAVFGIGMDYEVFLLARIFGARRDGASDEESIVRGVAASAPLITRAATIMVAVFIAFAMGDFIVIRMIGFALAAAVAIDATLIRLIVAPALMRIAGRRNWWPGERHMAANDFSTVRQPVVQSAP